MRKKEKPTYKTVGYPLNMSRPARYEISVVLHDGCDNGAIRSDIGSEHRGGKRKTGPALCRVWSRRSTLDRRHVPDINAINADEFSIVLNVCLSDSCT